MDFFTEPPFYEKPIGPDGQWTREWRKWLEQIYEWDAADPVQQIGMNYPLFPTFDTYNVMTDDEEPTVVWQVHLHELLKRINDLEQMVATLEATGAHRGNRFIQSKPVDVTADRALGTIYRNTNPTTLVVHVTVEIT